MFLNGVHDVTVDAVRPCGLCVVTINVLRKDVPKVSFCLCHDSSIRTTYDVIIAHEQSSVFMEMDWLHSPFPTGIARRCAWPVSDLADSVKLMSQAYIVQET
jgi:hypothetical protein